MNANSSALLREEILRHNKHYCFIKSGFSFIGFAQYYIHLLRGNMAKISFKSAYYGPLKKFGPITFDTEM